MGQDTNFVVDPFNQSQNTFKSNRHTKVNSKSLLWAGKHILHPFYLYSIFYPYSGGTANLQHSEKKQWGIEDRSLQVWHSLFLASQPLTPVGGKQASFRDDIFLPLFLGKKTKPEKINTRCSFSVCEKQAVPYFVLSRTSFFPTAVVHF